MSRSRLRAALWDLTGGMCEWPECSEQADEMAHIEPSGMGGRSSVDTIRNVWALCREHHNILDGRPSQMKTSRAIRDLAAGYLTTRRTMIEQVTP